MSAFASQGLGESLWYGFAHPLLGLDHAIFFVFAAMLSVLLNKSLATLLVPLLSCLVSFAAAYAWQLSDFVYTEYFVAISGLALAVVYWVPKHLELLAIPLMLLFASFHGLSFAEFMQLKSLAPMPAFLGGLLLSLCLLLFGLAYFFRKAFVHQPNTFDFIEHFLSAAVSGISLSYLYWSVI